MNRYFMDQDDSSHWYLIDVKYRKQWEKWLEALEEDPDNPNNWDIPKFAKRINGPNAITFSNPKEK